VLALASACLAPRSAKGASRAAAGGAGDPPESRGPARVPGRIAVGNGPIGGARRRRCSPSRRRVMRAFDLLFTVWLPTDGFAAAARSSPGQRLYQ